MRIIFILVACLIAKVLCAQPFFDRTNDPANGRHYVPGETLTANFTIIEDGELNGMRVTAKSDSTKSISALQPVLSLTDHYPPVKQYQLAVVIPDNFKSSDTAFVFEVTSAKYGKHTLEFTLVSQPADVETMELLCNLSLYPNPAQDILTIASPLLRSSDVTISIISVDGKQIMQTTAENIDVSRLAPGEYLILVSSSLGRAASQFIIR